MDAEHSDNAAEPVDNDSDEYFDGFDDGDSDVLSGDETDPYMWQYRGNESSSAVSPVDRDDPTRPWRPFTMPYQFRVLKVEQPKSSTDPISVKLVTRTLDSPGEFYALSYTWGEEEFTHFVYCGEHAIPVTANLHDALLVTRDLFYFRGVIHPDFHRSVYTPLAEREMCAPLQPFIWADAICINQRDHAERARQVMIMDRIFLAARHLFIWLGKAYERIIRESVATNGSTLHVLRPVWEAPWFQRRWVIQEANVKFKERSIITNATLLNISNLQNMVTGTVDAEWFSTSPLAETLKEPLLAQLLRYEDALCRDPRDLIYALSNISSDKLAIVPDYTKSPDEVFIDLGVYCVASGQVLPLMACAIARPLSIDKQYAAGDSLRCIGQGRAQNRQLISWIPDWRLSRRKISKKEHFSFSMCETAGQLPQIWHEGALVPSHTMQARVTHYPMANTLVIQGWLLGPYQTPKTLQHYRQESHQYDYISYRLRAEWQITKINRKLSESLESSTLKMLCLPHTNFTFLVQQVRPCADPHGRPIHLYRLVTYFLRESSRLMDGFSDGDLGKFISMNAPKLAFLWDERNQFPGYENAKLPDPEEVYII